MTQALSELGKKKLPQGKCLVIGGGCSDGESSLHIRRDHPTVTLSDLQANHEEADTRLLFHAKHASQPDSRIIIHSPDTDVLVLGISFYDELGCKELWLRTGSKDRLRYIPLHEISTKVGPKICKALPAFHALTGSDATSAFAGLGRKEPITSSKILKSIKKVCRSLVRSPSPRMRSSNVSSLYSASIQPLRKPRQAWTS